MLPFRPSMSRTLHRRTNAILLAFVLGACAGSKAGPKPDDDAIRLATAIRTAIPHAQGYTAVAAGVCEDDEDFYEVAFLDHGRVKRITVDSRNGSVDRVGDGNVRGDSESTAERLEKMLPGARVDLARAVEIAVGNGSGARAIGVEIDDVDGALVYLVTLLRSSRATRTTIDAATGAVLHTEEGPTNPAGSPPAGQEIGSGGETRR